MAGDDRGWTMREVQVDLDTTSSLTVPLMVAFYSDGSRVPDFHARDETDALFLLQERLSALESPAVPDSAPSKPTY